MTTTIKNAYVNALLADAVYVNVTPGMMPEDLSTALSEESKHFPQHLADFVAANFEVASAITSPDGSGFDATVWRGRAGTEFAGQVFVSTRGKWGHPGEMGSPGGNGVTRGKWGQVLPFAKRHAKASELGPPTVSGRKGQISLPLASSPEQQPRRAACPSCSGVCP